MKIVDFFVESRRMKKFLNTTSKKIIWPADGSRVTERLQVAHRMVKIDKPETSSGSRKD